MADASQIDQQEQARIALASLAHGMHDFGTHYPLKDALHAWQMIEQIERLAQSTKMLLAGRQLMQNLKNVFDSVPELDRLELDLFSNACDVEDDVVGYHDMDLQILNARINRGTQLEPSQSMNNLLAIMRDEAIEGQIEATLLAEGINIETLRVLMGVADHENGCLRINLSREMFGPAAAPACLADVCLQAVVGLSAEMDRTMQDPMEPPYTAPLATRPRQALTGNG